MRKLFYVSIVALAFAGGAFAQAANNFPGISAQQFEMLKAAKLVTPLPLPSWLPPGFKLEKVKMKLGSMVPMQDRELVLIYLKALPDGKKHCFALEAGFEGIGDLPYETTASVVSSIGKIEIAYQPPDSDDGGKKLNDFSMTHWFNVGKTPFHYDGMYAGESNDGLVMLPLAETKKILGSLRRF